VSWGASVNQQVTGTNTTITGLINGQHYHVTVRAQNAAGESQPVNAAPDPVTPQASVPGAPTGINLKPASGSVAASWTAPAGPVSKYQITTQPAGGQPLTVPAGMTSATVSGLTNGTPYRVTVAAVGPSGGASSGSAGPVTPFGVPGQVTGVSVTQPAATSLSVSFGGAAANGAPVTGAEQLAAAIRKSGPTLVLTVRDVRTGKEVPVEVQVPGRPREAGPASFPFPMPGANRPASGPAPAADGSRNRLGAVTEFTLYEVEAAVKVTEVVPDSPADRAGIHVGDILVGLHKFEMLSADHVRFVLNHPDAASFQPLKFYVLRGSQLQSGKFNLGE